MEIKAKFVKPIKFEILFDSSEEAFLKRLTKKRYVILSDKKVTRLYSKKIIPLLKSRNLYKGIITLNLSEENRDFETIQKVCKYLCTKHVDSSFGLIVLGGGLVQEIGAFVSHVYYRGIQEVKIPTTIVSMTDCIFDGKASLNIGGHKSKVGIFTFPSIVWIRPFFLKTLTNVQFREQFAEVVKDFFVFQRGDFTHFSDLLQKVIKSQDMRAIKEIISSDIKVKKSLFRGNYNENRFEATLFGHPVAYAIESFSKFKINHNKALIALFYINKSLPLIKQDKRQTSDNFCFFLPSKTKVKRILIKNKDFFDLANKIIKENKKILAI